MRYTIESVNEINKALEAMEPVLALAGNKEGGPNPLDQIFKTIGVGGAQRSDLQEIARAYQQYKLSEEQAQGVAGKKPAMTPDKSQPVVDNPRQVTPADPNAMADESELPPTEPLAFENQAVDGNTVKTVPSIAEPGRSSAPERLPQSNPLGLQVQSEAEANANPMVAGFIAPTDGSFRAGGDRNTAGSTVSSEAAPVATGGPLDLTRYYQKTMSAESSGIADAKNPRSSATGLFQFVEGTWKGLMRKYPELGLTPEGRTDPAQQKRAMEKFTQNNIQSLRKAGLPVTNGTLYLAHFAGDGGAKALLRADARTPVEEVLGAPAVKANPFLQGKTAGWAIRWAERKMS
jgi:hypothetical protein